MALKEEAGQVTLKPGRKMHFISRPGAREERYRQIPQELIKWQ